MNPLVLLVFYALHIYIYWKLLPCFRRGRKIFTAIYFLPATFITWFPMTLRYNLADEGARSSEVLYALSITDFVIAGMAACAFVFADVVKIFLGLWDRRNGTSNEAFMTPRRSAAFAVLVSSFVFGYGFWEVSNVRRVDITIPTDKLPVGTDRLRVVQISDVHIGGVYYTGHLEKIMNIVREAEPDILVVTGDLVDGNVSHRGRESELLASRGAKYGAFAVEGNHEYALNLDQAIDFIESSNLTFLESGEFAEAGGIIVAGLGDLAEIWPARLELPNDRFILLLKHRPQRPEGSAGKFDLMLAGHTHGGQIWVFNASMHRRYDFVQGLARYGDSFVYVSNGAGFWGPPVRILARPEVAVFDLARDI
jgi:predicted MPP superfamily phosphohydrolase